MSVRRNRCEPLSRALERERVAAGAKRRSLGEGFHAPQLDALTLPIASRWVPSLSRDEARERVVSMRSRCTRPSRVRQQIDQIPLVEPQDAREPRLGAARLAGLYQVDDL